MFPPGWKVLVHEKPVTRNTWGLRSIIGWYIGPYLNHYRCVRVYLPESKSERITDNITIITEYSISPDLSPHESILHSTKDFTQELQKYLKGKEMGPYHSTIESLGKLKELLPSLTEQSKGEYHIKNEDHNTIKRVNNKDTPDPPPTHEYPLRSKQNKHGLNSILDIKNGTPLEYRNLIRNPGTKNIWQRSFCNELGRLSGGFGGKIEGTNTISFISFNNIPHYRRGNITYGRILVDYRPHKEENIEPG